jgi:hypothetical protein
MASASLQRLKLSVQHASQGNLHSQQRCCHTLSETFTVAHSNATLLTRERPSAAAVAWLHQPALPACPTDSVKPPAANHNHPSTEVADQHVLNVYFQGNIALMLEQIKRSQLCFSVSNAQPL